MAWKLRENVILQTGSRRDSSGQGLAITTAGHDNVWGTRGKRLLAMCTDSKVAEGFDNQAACQY